MYKILFILFFVSVSNFLNGQGKSIQEHDHNFLNWFNHDIEDNEIFGISLEKAHQTVLKDYTVKKTVVVAVIDGGVDIDHEDLKGKIWINEKEIAGNGIDDDNNGYIDDIHGWNFLGNSTGDNIHQENLEYTRIIKKNDESVKDYQKAKTLYDEEFSKRKAEKLNLAKFEEIYNKTRSIILESTGIEVNSLKDVKKVNSDEESVLRAKAFLEERYTQGFTEDILISLKERNALFLDYYLNTSYNPREVIGDDPENLEDKSYGNNDVKGPKADHGTGVAGIIAANRNNGIGINGITSNAKIMALRTTPDGDERDKDVALAIIYAVDNGADIINMSFGKPLSPNKEFVDKAVRYAEKNNVLMVHSSGNSALNIDLEKSYPTDIYADGTLATNWITIGASDKKSDDEIAGIFSNYGKSNVDLFAPGVDIISLDIENTYSKHDGTSFSAPVVSGVAALILSYYPELSPQELIKVLMDGSVKINKPKKVLQPDITSEKRPKVKFSELSRSGGIVNVYGSLLLLEETKE